MCSRAYVYAKDRISCRKLAIYTPVKLDKLICRGLIAATTSWIFYYRDEGSFVDAEIMFAAGTKFSRATWTENWIYRCAQRNLIRAL